MDRCTLEQAIELLVENTNVIDDVEEISLWDGGHRVLAEDITAFLDQPPFPRSPLDGYAVRSEDIADASKEHPVQLQVIDEVDAGYVTEKRVEAGMAVRIMTGAPIPEGADCVLKQEDTDYGEDIVNVYAPVKHFQNYCFEGEDYKAGDCLVSKNNMLSAVDVGVAAGTGRTGLKVYRKPRVAVYTSGDELKQPGEELKPGKIYGNNLHTMVVQLGLWGIDVVGKEFVMDDAEALAERIRNVIDDVDMIITSGGVSVGKKDIMHDVAKILGCERVFWKIAIKPGMPTLCLKYRGKLILCLSGNPFGAVVNLELLGRPVFAKMMRRDDLQIVRASAILENGYPKKGGFIRYVRSYYKDGRVRVADGSNDSGILSTMCGCNCLLEIPAGTEKLEAGDEVTVVIL
jgi:molybdopterin molybdotransferase